MMMMMVVVVVVVAAAVVVEHWNEIYFYFKKKKIPHIEMQYVFHSFLYSVYKLKVIVEYYFHGI